MLIGDMSTYLAELLSTETKSFKKFIEDVEFATGCNKNDLKLSSDIKVATNHKIRSLGLNPEDTTAAELYHCLNNLLKLHDQFIIKKFEISYEDSTSVALAKITKDFSRSINGQSVLCIKPNILKRILAKNKPIKTTGLLGYRSFASMLKNEDPKTVLSLAYYIEDEKWRTNYFDQIRNLSTNDFEYKSVKFVILDNRKFSKIAKEIADINRHNVISVENTGQILVVPLDSKLLPGFCILTYAYIINRLKSTVAFSTFIQNHRFNSNFGENTARLLKDSDAVNYYISKYNLSWDSISAPDSSTELTSDETNGDMLSQQNLDNTNQLDQILIKLEPALSFWSDCDNLGYFKNDKVVSLNLLDVCYNFYNQLSVSDNSHIFMEVAINKSLVGKYLDSTVAHQQILKQISEAPEDNDFMQVFKNRIVYT
jgi:hypothetical protein